MRKSILFASMAALIMSSCSSNEFDFGGSDAGSKLQVSASIHELQTRAHDTSGMPMTLSVCRMPTITPMLSMSLLVETAYSPATMSSISWATKITVSPLTILTTKAYQPRTKSSHSMSQPTICTAQLLLLAKIQMLPSPSPTRCRSYRLP